MGKRRDGYIIWLPLVFFLLIAIGTSAIRWAVYHDARCIVTHCVVVKH